MSSALAIAAVTASLKDLLNDGLIDHDLSTVGSFAITAQPPDRVTTGATENNQLNLFLYQVTPNSGWRNVGLPSRDHTGDRLTNAPLALDLHYLLTAYGAQDLNAEVLLGYAMQVLHESPVLTRQQLRTALGAPAPVDGTLLPGPFGSLSAVDLADQVEQIKVTPVYLSSEDLSKLWTAMQARYRPSMAYLVSVVLIQSQGPAKSALPVLKRGKDDRGVIAHGAPAPTLASARAEATPVQPALRLGEDLLLLGTNLLQANMTVRLEHARLDVVRELGQQPVDASRVRVHLPSIAEDANGMADWAVGVYMASLKMSAPGEPTWITNGVPMALSPLITVNPLNQAAGTINLTVTCTPRLRPSQHADVRLLFGEAEVLPVSINTPADPSQPTSLTFSVPGIAAGDYVTRLRVEGIDSLPVVYSGTPPTFTFDAAQTVHVT
jgi:uncharacterized protein DUF4255